MSDTNESPQKKKQIPFIEILKQAARIVWEHRFLLWFGLLLALGSPESFNIGRNNNKLDHQGEAAKNFLANHWQTVAVIAVVVFIVGILLFLVSLVAKAGLVKSVNLIVLHKTTSFREGWRSGKKYLGTLLGLSLLFFIAVFLVVVVLAIPVIYLIAAQSWFSAILVGILAIAIFFPLIFIFTITKTYAEFYIILSDIHLGSAIETGYLLLLKNIGNSIIFSLLLFAVSLVAGIVLLPVAGIALVILVPTGITFFYLSKIAFAIFIGFAVLLFVAALLFVSSIFQTYKMTAWTLFFQEIAKVEKKPEAEEVAEEGLEELPATPEKVI
ncbi:MAG TPA: hypothetical protein VK254_00565 [Candidatus Bathyarchaeia archaeon]|nr:hypothetical protein [Candidatus Bathyarchaeia archaeon]